MQLSKKQTQGPVTIKAQEKALQKKKNPWSENGYKENYWLTEVELDRFKGRVIGVCVEEKRCNCDAQKAEILERGKSR